MRCNHSNLLQSQRTSKPDSQIYGKTTIRNRDMQSQSNDDNDAPDLRLKDFLLTRSPVFRELADLRAKVSPATDPDFLLM
jgi:hypothetical protein